MTRRPADIFTPSPPGRASVPASPSPFGWQGKLGLARTLALPGLFWRRSSRDAFSLLEVMIACGVFFMAVFAILAMVSTVLRNARGLQRTELDAGMVAAQACLTNRLTEGTESGDFGKMYPDYSWETEAFPAETNGLWQVDIRVFRRGGGKPVDTMSILLYRPESQQGFGRPTFR